MRSSPPPGLKACRGQNRHEHPAAHLASGLPFVGSFKGDIDRAPLNGDVGVGLDIDIGLDIDAEVDVDIDV